jgi:hypothetical protein
MQPQRKHPVVPKRPPLAVKRAPRPALKPMPRMMPKQHRGGR